MSGIFISHRSTEPDRSVAHDLKRRLEQLGHKQIFLDTDPVDGIRAGQQWERVLYDKVRSSRAVIVVHSSRWTASKWCFSELTQARALGKHIIPMQIDTSDLDKLLSERQAIDMTSGLDGGFPQLAADLVAAGVDPADAFTWQGDRPPYPGLSSFEEEDAAVFFGRQDEIDAGLDLLNRARRRGSGALTMVLGASGSGKSSLVRAGLVPRLRRDGRRWVVTRPFRPGHDPFRRLAEVLSAPLYEGDRGRDRPALERRLRSAEGPAAFVALADDLREKTASDASLVVVVDQFEELIGRDAAPGRGAAHGETGGDGSSFVELLAATVTTRGSGVIVVATLRSDLLDLLQNYPPMEQVSYDTLLVGPLVEKLRDVIQEPAERAKLHLESKLVDEMVDDARGNDEALPLVAFTLADLWERFGREHQRIEHADYVTIGGLTGSIAKAADRVLDDPPLDSEQERRLRQAFLAMARRRGGSGWVRRTAELSEIDESISPVLGRFEEERLLVLDEAAGTVEVAHEALLRVWPKARRWLAEGEEVAIFRDDLEAAARRWDDNGRPDGALWSDTPLHRAEEYRNSGDLRPNEVTRQFVDAGAAAEQAEAERVDRARRRRLMTVTGVAAVLFALLILSGFFFVEARRDERAARQATARATAAALAARSRELQADDPALAVAVAVEAMATTDPPRAVATEALIGAQAAYQDLALHETGDLSHPEPDAPVEAVAITDDGAVVATGRGEPDNTMRLWERDTGELIAQISTGGGRLRDVAMASDGASVAAAADDGDDGIVLLFQVADGGIPAAPVEFRHPDARVGTIAFHPDSDVVAAGDSVGRLFLWSRTTPDAAEAEVVLPDGGAVLAVAFDSNGTYIAAARAGGAVDLVTMATGDVVTLPAPAPQDATAVAFHPDGDLLATGYRQGQIFLWQDPAGDPVQAPRLLAAHTDNVLALAFSPVEPDWLVSSSRDRTIRLWSIERGTQVGAPPHAHTDWVTDVVFEPDGRHLVSGSRDESVRFWEYRGTSLLGHHDDCTTPKELGCFATDVAFSVDNRVLASVAFDGKVRLWDVGGGDPRTLDDPDTEEELSEVVFSPTDSNTLIAVGSGGSVWWWNGVGDELEATRHRVVGPSESTPRVRSVAFSDDGALAATADDSGVVVLWDVRSRTQRVEPVQIPRGRAEDDQEIHALAFGPTGRLMIGDRAGRLWIWDWAAGRGPADAVPEARAHESNIRGLAFSPDGKLLASGARDNTVRLWSVDATKPIELRATLFGHDGEVAAVVFHSDGGWLASPGNEGNLRMWSVGAEQQVRAEIIPDPRCGAGDRCFVLGADFSDDGLLLAAAESDGGIRLWRGPLWDLELACAIATEPITAAKLDAELGAQGLSSTQDRCSPGD